MKTIVSYFAWHTIVNSPWLIVGLGGGGVLASLLFLTGTARVVLIALGGVTAGTWAYFHYASKATPPHAVESWEAILAGVGALILSLLLMGISAGVAGVFRRKKSGAESDKESESKWG